jgi:hypothetical protein
MEKRALIALALSFVVFMAFIFLGKLKHPGRLRPKPPRPNPRRRPRRRRLAARPRPAVKAAADGRPKGRGGGHPLFKRYSPNWAAQELPVKKIK